MPEFEPQLIESAILMLELVDECFKNVLDSMTVLAFALTRIREGNELSDEEIAKMLEALDADQKSLQGRRELAREMLDRWKALRVKQI